MHSGQIMILLSTGGRFRYAMLFHMNLGEKSVVCCAQDIIQLIHAMARFLICRTRMTLHATIKLIPFTIPIVDDRQDRRLFCMKRRLLTEFGCFRACREGPNRGEVIIAHACLGSYTLSSHGVLLYRPRIACRVTRAAASGSRMSQPAWRDAYSRQDNPFSSRSIPCLGA